MSYKIYSWHGNPRGDICKIAAEFAKVQYEFVNIEYSETKSEEYLARHSLGKVPLVEGPEGSFFETTAILKFFSRKADMLGEDNFARAQVQQWLDYLNSTFLQKAFPIFAMNLGRTPFVEATYKQVLPELNEQFKYLNNYLTQQTYLAGERLSAADVALYVWLAPFFRMVIDENQRKSLVSLTRWYKHVSSFAAIKKFYRGAHMCQKAWISVKIEKPQGQKAEKPKKEQAKKEQPKKEDKPKKEEKPAKPAGDPLLALPESKFNLFDFKTFIVNEKDRKKGCAEFWKQYDPEGYSIWHVKYDKYEGEGVVLYQTSNFKDSFLQRLDHFRKFCYGIHGVYGEDKNYEVEGVWVWRGTGIPQQIKDLPNYEYHFWNKLDHTKEADRKLLEEYWCGLEEDVAVVNGKVARDVTQFK